MVHSLFMVLSLGILVNGMTPNIINAEKKVRGLISFTISIVFLIHSHIKINTDRYSGDVRNRRRGRDFCERNDSDNHFRNV